MNRFEAWQGIYINPRLVYSLLSCRELSDSQRQSRRRTGLVFRLTMCQCLRKLFNVGSLFKLLFAYNTFVPFSFT